MQGQEVSLPALDGRAVVSCLQGPSSSPDAKACRDDYFTSTDRVPLLVLEAEGTVPSGYTPTSPRVERR